MASAPWQQPHEFGPSKVQVTILASEWASSKGALSTINRELAIQLAKFPEVQITYFLPTCSYEDKNEAHRHGITILEATRLTGYDELEWLIFPPEHLQIDVIVGHGVKLGRQAQLIRNSHKCQWVQVVHTHQEELGMFKSYKNPISRGEEKHNVEVELCKMADFVVGVGPKQARAFRAYLRSCNRDHDVFEFTPGIFDEFVSIQQLYEEQKHFTVLVFGRGDAEDFELKGFDVAARSVAALPDTRLVFVGAPDGKHEEIANRLCECGIPKNRLRVRGYVKTREDLKGLFSEVDLVLVLSRTEGFGLTGLEALSAGLPVIVSKNSGFGEALCDVPFGSLFVIDSEDPNVWTAAIKDIWSKNRQTRLEQAMVLRDCYAMTYSWSVQCKDLLKNIINSVNDASCERQMPSEAQGKLKRKSIKDGKGSSVPPEILSRGSKAVYAYQKALQTGKVKVYRGRIIILGQARAGKTSLKKSLLSLDFNSCQESTVGVEACEVEVDQVMNWTQIEQKKPEKSEFKDNIARLMAKDLIQTGADKKNVVQKSSLVKEVKDQENLESSSNEAESSSYMGQKSEIAEEVENSKAKGPVEKSNKLTLNIYTATPPNDVIALTVRYLQNRQLEDDIKTKEKILTLWDFAGQQVYYAAHSVFLSQRAVYVLVYNLNENLLAEAKPRCRQGMSEILLDNFNNESNLDNLLSWLVSVHCIRSGAIDVHKNLENEKKKLPYLRPPVIIVGTHADLHFEDVRTTEKRIEKIISGQEYGGHVIAPFFAVNNKTKNDQGVQGLRQKIMEVLENEPYMGEEVPLRWFLFEKVVEDRVAQTIYHMDLDQLLPVIKHVCHIDDEYETALMLNFYHDLGVIVKHGRTVVLQAQWLIDLFKQLITVPRFDEAVPKYRKYWKELQDTGILKTALVDHVFSDFIEKGLRKQDILGMMELYGLIAKFSSGMSISENEEEQIYFVPSQLTSSPSELCEIKPSERDPCPLFVHFLDGFVPHGLFPQFVSKCISWCSENGFKETPKLYNSGASFLLGKHIIFALICRKRFIKVVLQSLPCSNKMAIKVRTFIEETLKGFSQELSWLSNLQYQLSVACTHCLQSDQDDSLVLLQVLPCGEVASCRKNFSHSAVTVPGLEKWFELQHSQNEKREMDMSSEAVDLDVRFPCKSGTPSDDDLFNIAENLGGQWKWVGRRLHVPERVLEQIEDDYTGLSEKCFQVLRYWMDSADDTTYQILAQALQNAGKRQLAEEYCGLPSCKKQKVG